MRTLRSFSLMSFSFIFYDTGSRRFRDQRDKRGLGHALSLRGIVLLRRPLYRICGI